MSKGNMLLGHARGKVGDLVFSRTNGQQVVRARAAVVKNPQTEAQMIQRIILNTVAQAYSRMSAITDHSFEGVQEGQKTMSAFLRKNINALRARVSAAVADPTQGLNEVRQFSPIGTNTFSLNAFVIASGSLPSVEVSVPEQGATTFATVNVGGSTYGDIIDSLGLQRGDQLTFLDFRLAAGRQWAFKYARIILDPTNEDMTEAPLSTPLLTDAGAVNLPSPRNTGEFGAISIANNVLSFAVGAATQEVGGAAIIASRKGSDGNWLRSNTQLTVAEWGLLMGLSMQEALDLFEEGGFSSLNAQFLNNAGTGALAGTGESELAKLAIQGIATYNQTGESVALYSAGSTISQLAALFTQSTEAYQLTIYSPVFTDSSVGRIRKVHDGQTTSITTLDGSTGRLYFNGGMSSANAPVAGDKVLVQVQAANGDYIDVMTINVVSA